MKTVHIISHSHWDREWYLPYERHHMLLVELIDNVLELFQTDPEFKSFYLDGQTIVLDDYLEVRPEKEELLRKYIENGQLKIGPFYILQDAFLTSSESNVRNMLIGHQESEKWGAKTEIGYYPDTFGNVGQTPQLMKQLGFEFAAYGRGVKPTGFANKSTEDDNFVSAYSEMKWLGVDDSEIYGLLFANWYSNGNEIPSDKENARTFWDQKLEEAENYASTDHLLFMNGCDHQPVQRDLSKAIRLANELYPDYHFVHSDFTTYMNQMVEDLSDDLDQVKGELTSQETEGWYTLTNTASSRVYLKQENAKISRLYENIAEPLAAMAYDTTGVYPHDILDYGWKLYMQNHPHDSICGCSIDEVHEEMMTRFQKAESVANYVIDESLKNLSCAIDTETHAPEDSIPFIIFNTSGHKKSQSLSVSIETDKISFGELYPTQGYEKLLNDNAPIEYEVVDAEGKKIPAKITVNEPEFNYDLPKDGFREPYMTRTITVDLYVEELPGFSWQTLYVIPAEMKASTPETSQSLTLDNDYLNVQIAKDGTLEILDKVNDVTYERMLVFEDTGDIGNEYVYKKPNGEKPIYSQNKLVDAFVVENTEFNKQLALVHEIAVPLSANEQLDLEQKKVVEFRDRKAQRVKETKPLIIKTIVSLDKAARHLTFKTTVRNEMKDHRLRVLFDTPIQSDHHYADSIFETVKRNNQVSSVWTNPENPQRTHRFIQVSNEEFGMFVEPEGVNEYEVIDKDGKGLTVALTLFRSVGEMGDWGYFPTPGAQCLDRTFEFTYHLSFHSDNNINDIRQEAIYRQIPLVYKQVNIQNGSLPAEKQYLSLSSNKAAVTAMKRTRGSNQLITRLYNYSDSEGDFNMEFKNHKPFISSILEEEGEALSKTKLGPFEILTLKWEKMGEASIEN
ncbi:MAG: alpha-mannosidase [Alkalibacterium sp.]|nr:alpha-mannosidase [Alkalibacterium sp.]